MVVGLNVAARARLQVGVLDADLIAVRHAANAEEQRFTVTPGVSAIAVGDPDVKQRAVVRSRCDRRVECNGYALSKALHENSARFGILAIQELTAPDDHQRVHVDSVEEMPKLTRDITAADNRDRLWHFLELEDFVAGPIWNIERKSLRAAPVARTNLSAEIEVLFIRSVRLEVNAAWLR